MTASVFVSGTSSGIGRACVRRLAESGYHVYAGVRTAADVHLWTDLVDVEPVIVDLTSTEQVEDAHRRMAEGNDRYPLAALVNNAGTMRTGTVEQLSMADVRYMFDANLFGHWRLIQLCIPLLRVSRGRIVNIGSTNGRMSAPSQAAYSGAKHALEALSESLQLELCEQGIAVSIVEPGAIRTALWDKVLDWESRQPIAAAGRSVVVKREQKLRYLRDNSLPADEVAKAVLRAVRAKRPAYRYVVGKDARIRVAMTSLLPRQALHALRRLKG